MRKIINILNIMICLTMLNFVATGNEDDLRGYGMDEIGCGKYEYTNNSTRLEFPDHLF